MTGDAAADPSEPRKVLGLIWETFEDKLQVDVKLNTGGRWEVPESRMTSIWRET
jgi:hypothetical protein